MQAGRKHTNRTIEVYDVLPPEPTSRRAPVRQARPVLVEDAVFEVVAPSPRHRVHNDNATGGVPQRPRPERRFDVARLDGGVGAFLVDRLERLLSRLSTQAFATLSVSLFLIVFWICGGFGALDRQPIAAQASPFVIERVFTESLDENGMRLLAVGGMLRNHSGGRLDAPTLSVVGEGGAMVGSIVPPVAELAAGQSVRFFGRFKLEGGKSGAVTIFPVP